SCPAIPSILSSGLPASALDSSCPRASLAAPRLLVVRSGVAGELPNVGGDLVQCVRENLHGLSTLNEIFLVDDYRGHRADALLSVRLFARSHLLRMEVRFENL